MVRLKVIDATILSGEIEDLSFSSVDEMNNYILDNYATSKYDNWGKKLLTPSEYKFKEQKTQYWNYLDDIVNQDDDESLIKTLNFNQFITSDFFEEPDESFVFEIEYTGEIKIEIK
jgi:hypothetical protein